MPGSSRSFAGKRDSNLLIWDGDTPCPVGIGPTVLWRDFTKDNAPDIVSIPQLIEEDAKVLRLRYLAWVYELGEMRIERKRLSDHLRLDSGFSYWWMTLLVEKCNFAKSQQIDDAVRLLAFTDWAVARSFKCITLASANRPLAECLQDWCEKSGVEFDLQCLPSSIVPLSWVRRAYAALPLAIQAWVWLLKYLLVRWPLRGVGLQQWRKTSGQVAFFSYLFNLVPESAAVGRYESRYWGHLPEVLKREGCKTNWLHIYITDAFLSNAKKAATTIRAFNETGRGTEVHVTLDTFLSLRIVARTLIDWFKLAQKGKRLQGSIATAAHASSYLWPLFVKDWFESTRGVTAMKNALNRSLFDAAMKALPKQRVGCYLQENQGWEFALVQGWKNANHGMSVGVAHSSVRFWDLRYFFDPRSYRQKGNNSMPLPDRVAVNGQASTEAYLAGGYPVENLVQVEALRYLYLDRSSMRPLSRSSSSRPGLRLLVLGDYLAKNTQLQMRLLAQAASSLPDGTEITVKPHPAYFISIQDYPELDLNVVTKPLENLLSECDVAYTSSVTTAALDAYCFGVPVISVLDPTTLNMNPLRGYPGTFYVSSGAELIRTLHSIHSCKFNSSTKANIFTLDMALPLWRQLLACAI